MKGPAYRGPANRRPAAHHRIAYRLLAAGCVAAALLVSWLSAPAVADDAAGAPPAPRYPAGASTFQANCSVCHQAKGTGNPALAPPITAYPARYATLAEGRKQLAMTVVNGMFGKIEVEQKSFDFRLPEITQFDDATLATVLNFVIFDLDHASGDTKPITADEIAAERAHPVEGSAVREHRAKVLAALGL